MREKQTLRGVTANNLVTKQQQWQQIKGKSRVYLGGVLMVQMVKNLPATWETQVPSLSREDPLEKGMTAHSSIFAWRILWIDATIHGVTKSQR